MAPRRTQLEEIAVNGAFDDLFNEAKRSVTGRVNTAIKQVENKIAPTAQLARTLLDPNTRMEAVEWISFESNVTPPFRADKPFVSTSQEPPAGTTPIMRQIGKVVKPRFVLKLMGVSTPVTYTPFGVPDPMAWKVTYAVIGGGIGLLILLAARGAWKR